MKKKTAIRPFNGHLQVENKILTCAYVYLTNAHAFFTYYGVIGGGAYHVRKGNNKKLQSVDHPFFIDILIEELRVVNGLVTNGLGAD